MKKLLLYICLLLTQATIAQKADFTINGTVDLDNGTIYMMPGFNPIYFPEDINAGSPIVKGKFSFSGKISYPLTAIFYIKEGERVKYRSTKFFLDKGVQKANWKLDEKYASPVVIDNDAAKEQQQYLSRYQPNDERLYQLYVNINGLGEDPESQKIRRVLQREKDSLDEANKQITLNTTRQNPTSFIPLWNMVFELDLGYHPFLDTFYQTLSTELKNSVTGKAYAEGVAKLRRTAIGSIFPAMQLSDTKGQQTTITPKHKYTLIDFWYSGCYPCIRLFPGFKKVYEAYHNKGFELIGVSTDEGEYINDWKRYLTEHQLPWPQYLDDDKQNAQMLLITRYPTSFLLDSEGRIIMQDILPDELEKFLKVNLP